MSASIPKPNNRQGRRAYGAKMRPGASHCLVVALLLILLTACQPAPPAPTVPALTPASTEAPFFAPDFALATLDGETVRLSDLRGGWVVVNFWATWCAPCVAEMPVLAALDAEFGGALTVLAINQREDRATVEAFIEMHNLALTVLFSDDATLLAYQVIGLPQTVVVAPNGAVVWRQFGPVTLETFGADLRSRMTG